MDDLFGDFSAAYSIFQNPHASNDTIATAGNIGEGRLDVAGDGVDWFRFAAQAGVIDIAMTPSGALQDLNMELLNAAGQVVATGFTPTGAEKLSFEAREGGTYFIKVYSARYGDDPPAGIKLDYSLGLDLPQVIVNDNNNTRATALALGAGQHEIIGREVDWFRIDSPSGALSIRMSAVELLDDSRDFRDDIANLNMELYNSSGQVVRANFSASNTEAVDYLAPTDGTYYLKVYKAQFGHSAPDGTLLSYRLDVDLPERVISDGNDNRATATSIEEGLHAFKGTGVDWFTLQAGPGKITLTMTPVTVIGGQSQNLSLELYNAAGKVIRTDFRPNGAETVSFLSPESGTYYAKVYLAAYPSGAPNGVLLDYTLNVDLPDNSWSKKLDFGPIRNASVSVYDIDNDGRDEIFIGTSKALDGQGNEIRPAGLIVLEDDRTIKWTATFDAAEGVDPKTGKTYRTTSVTTAPTFSDVNGDGKIDIVVGVGADNRGEFGSVGQPGDKGGLYALDANGNELWYFQTRDTFGDDNRPDGVYGAPLVYDIDADGVREVMFTAWDHYLYTLDGRTGRLEREINLHDTAGATPALADLNNDGLYELVVPADITANAAAGLPAQGGILHVFSNYGNANIPGWMDQVGTTTHPDYRGKFEPQSLWSSAKIVDIDQDGKSEIIVGTGNFFQDANGQYIKVWNADGTLRYRLDTVGRTLATPLIADLDGDGSNEIIAATIAGNVYAWNSSGKQIFTADVQPFMPGATGPANLPIVRQPIAVDIDNADGDLEILISIGSQMIVLDSDGTQLTSIDGAEHVFSTYAGSPVARDIDGDGKLDFITGGTTHDQTQAVVYRFENIEGAGPGGFRTGAYQDNQSLHNIQNFIDRFYTTILGREADPAGRNDWVDDLHTGVRSGADVARGFIFSREFAASGTTNAEFINVLYRAFFGRAADTGGFLGWLAELADGMSRSDVLDGFIGSREFANLANSYGIQTRISFGASSNAAVIVGGEEEAHILRGGSGNNTIYDGGTQVEETGLSRETLSGQVYRLYGATLNRVPDNTGFQGWFDGIDDGRITVEQAAASFVDSREFQRTYGSLTDTHFVELLYRNVLGRGADSAGLASWLGQLDDGASRASVVLGFSESREFQNKTNDGLSDFMRKAQPLWNDVIEGGAGNDVMNGGAGADVFIFRAAQGGSDVIHGFEFWDELQLSGFGYDDANDALSHMTQAGANVIFRDRAQEITFTNTDLANMRRVRFNVS